MTEATDKVSDEALDLDEHKNLKHSSALRLLASAIWPSFKRASSAIFSIIGLPLFVLAIISASNVLSELGVQSLGETAQGLFAVYEAAQGWLVQQFSHIGLQIPALVLSGLIIYFSTGNTMAKSERGAILAVTLDRSEWRSSFKQIFQKFRVDSTFYLVPRLIRGVAVRLLWPLLALHRLHTPFEVEGPGPSGDWISTSVRRKDLGDFSQMVSDSGVWAEQIVYDQRQVLIWHIVFVGGGSWMVNALVRLIESA